MGISVYLAEFGGESVPQPKPVMDACLLVQPAPSQLGCWIHASYHHYYA